MTSWYTIESNNAYENVTDINILPLSRYCAPLPFEAPPRGFVSNLCNRVNRTPLLTICELSQFLDALTGTNRQATVYEGY